MSKLAVGARVHYWPSHNDGVAPVYAGEPCAAIVAYAWSPDCVNLAVFDHEGGVHQRNHVRFWDGRGDLPPLPYCVPGELIPSQPEFR